MAWYEYSPAVRRDEDARDRGKRSAELVDPDRVELPQLQLLPQLHPCCRRAPVLGLLPGEAKYSGRSGSRGRTRPTHRGHSTRRRPSRSTIVYT